jgi:hypothetical protein
MTSVATRVETTAVMEANSHFPVSRCRPVPLLAALACLGLLLATPSPAGASNVSLKKTLSTWSQRVGADAKGISLSASRRHPRRMTGRAQRFRLDALRARRALAAQTPSGARGLHAKRLAMAAFRAYALVGREWALSGSARLRHKKALAGRYAQLALRYARRGNRLLVSAGRLLR